MLTAAQALMSAGEIRLGRCGLSGWRRIRGAAVQLVRRSRRIALLCALAGCFGACSTRDSFDASQVPRIVVTTNPSIATVRFTWTPDGAQQLRVFKGSVVDSNPTSLWWSASATGRNTMRSGIEYGTTVITGGTRDMPQKSLVPGQTYTVQVTRSDPQTSDTGPTATTTVRYSSAQTFAIPASIVPP